MKRRIRLTALCGGTFLVISTIMSYILNGGLDTTLVAGQTIGGIIIGLFIAPHFRQESEEKAQRLIRVNRIITNTMYIFLVLFLIMFSLNFISDSIDWKAVLYFSIPLVITVLVKLTYRWRMKKVIR